MEAEIQFRFAVREDVPLIFKFIKDLAAYENLSDKVVVTEAILDDWLFAQQKAEVIFCELAGNPIGFTLFFYNFSTFVGKPGIYLEDLFVEPEYRGKGYGKSLLIELAKIAEAENCGRLEWSVLDWNTPSIEFYKSLGAKPMDEWTVFRLDKEGISKLAKK